MRFFRYNIFLMVILSMMMGCAAKSQNITNQNEKDKIQAKIIAVLPIESKSSNDKAVQLLRSRLLEELYFKGYPKIPLETVDAKLESLHVKKVYAVPPQKLKEILGADAGMYCSLTEDNKSKIFYAPIKIAVRCELRSTETGDVLWKSQSESVRRNFDFTNKGLEKKSRQDFEAVIDEVVNKVIKTLPDGPNLRS
ncbi:MAG: DUF799 family lipoprotein [Deltaproteobacteria bacterium]|nr:DUF799 family lipoprotein [Deltaproteobacteria bacterium]